MTKEETKSMEKYGITSKQVTVYFYKGFKYEKLDDALSYAKVDAVQEGSLLRSERSGR